MTAKESDKAYFDGAATWARDRRDHLRSSRRIAWIVASGAAIIAVGEALALVSLAPLKTVVPYTLLVDRTTGYVQALKPLDAQFIKADAALTRSFLVQYVIAREGFDINSLQSDYRKVALWSAGDARTDYLAGMQASNSSSPLAKYSRSSIVDVRVKSVNDIGRNVALVRFDTQRHDQGGATGPIRDWAVVIRYGFSAEPMSEDDRMIDPLGFKVAHYRVSPESPPTQPASVSTPVFSASGPPRSAALEGEVGAVRLPSTRQLPTMPIGTHGAPSAFPMSHPQSTPPHANASADAPRAAAGAPL